MDQAETKRAIRQAERFWQKELCPFNTDTEILEMATRVFKLRLLPDSATIPLVKRYNNRLHKRLNLSSDKPHIMKMFKKHRFNQIEKEVLLLFIISETF